LISQCGYWYFITHLGRIKEEEQSVVGLVTGKQGKKWVAAFHMRVALWGDGGSDVTLATVCLGLVSLVVAALSALA
jgi:hypothetical protein